MRRFQSVGKHNFIVGATNWKRCFQLPFIVNICTIRTKINFYGIKGFM